MIGINGGTFVDEVGRTRLLRGVNLGGSSKVPRRPNGATHLSEGFFDHRELSFVGRPFPLAEADEHFGRLRHWGLTVARLVVTWEAIEHAGPGLYDEAYLDYVAALVGRAGDHGISLIVDPHQDTWSRHFGGDGAPGWTLEAIGMEPSMVHGTGSAVLHQLHEGPLPHLLWSTNGARFGAATLFTLFFAGALFAPETRIDGVPAQEYLQGRYCAAIVELARRLADRPNVIGYDTMNEPLSGYVGLRDLRSLAGPLKIGASPTPLQSMLLASGYRQRVAVYEMRALGAHRTGWRTVNPGGLRLWRPGFECPWLRHGVWEVAPDGTPRLARPDYFARVDGRAVDFGRDCLLPFINRFGRAVRAAAPRALIFIESPVDSSPPRWSESDAGRIVYAPHWYDPLTLVRRRFFSRLAYDSQAHRMVVGRAAVRRAVARQLAHFRSEADRLLRGAPVLLGETGIPFDLDGGRAYRTGDFAKQIEAVDRIMSGAEATLLSLAWWNYTSDNDNLHGDQWNGEDFSIYSPDQRSDPRDLSSGGRALPALVRPYPVAIAGEPLSMRFERRRARFTLTFRHDPAVEAPTLIYIPALHYPRGFEVRLSDGRWEAERDPQIVAYRHSRERPVHTLAVLPKR